MVSHLTFPYLWIECIVEECDKAAHSDMDADTLNDLPREWVAEMLGVTHLDETKIYWADDDNKLHREDGPAIERADGSKEWSFHGIRHRVGGPAVVNEKVTSWYLNGELHREDGPALQDSDGRTLWMVHGEYMKQRNILLQQMKSWLARHQKHLLLWNKFR